MLQLKILFLFIFTLNSTVFTLELNILSQFESTIELFNNFKGFLFDVNYENYEDFEDAYLITPELIQKYGYKAERHTVQTADGYELGMHRIPNEGRQPVLLMHGLLDSSATWVIMGPKKGLAYLLADHGYDVWMGNARGNRYSRRHVSLNLSSSKFWDFSFHEIGKYDLPVMIDYVLKKTKYEKLHYVGHSQGATAFFIMCSESPEYNNKILSVQAMGPVVYFSHCKSPIIQLLLPFTSFMEELSKLLGLTECLPNSNYWTLFGQKFCKTGDPTQLFCIDLLFKYVGSTEKQTNITMIPIIMGHAPAGVASKQFLHFGQIANSERFRQYDHGWLKNLEKYNQIVPFEYNLSRVKAKIALHHSPNDWMAQPEDIEKLYEKLPNTIGKFLVEDQEFNHVDFVWGMGARKLVYEKIVKIIKLIENGDI